MQNTSVSANQLPTPTMIGSFRPAPEPSTTLLLPGLSGRYLWSECGNQVIRWNPFHGEKPWITAKSDPECFASVTPIHNDEQFVAITKDGFCSFDQSGMQVLFQVPEGTATALLSKNEKYCLLVGQSVREVWSLDTRSKLPSDLAKREQQDRSIAQSNNSESLYAISPSGRWFAWTNNKGTSLWLCAVEDNVVSFKGHLQDTLKAALKKPRRSTEDIYALRLEFLPDSKHLTLVRSDGCVVCVSIPDFVIVWSKQLSTRVCNASFSHDGRFLITIEDDNSIVLRSLVDHASIAEKREFASLHPPSLSDILLCVTRDDQWLITEQIGGERLFYELPSLQLAMREEHSSPITSIDWQPDTTLVWCSNNQTTVNRWNMTRNEKLLSLEAQGPVYQVYCPPITSRLYAAGAKYNKTPGFATFVDLYDTQLGERVATMDVALTQRSGRVFEEDMETGFFFEQDLLACRESGNKTRLYRLTSLHPLPHTIDGQHVTAHPNGLCWKRASVYDDDIWAWSSMVGNEESTTLSEHAPVMQWIWLDANHALRRVGWDCEGKINKTQLWTCNDNTVQWTKQTGRRGGNWLAISRNKQWAAHDVDHGDGRWSVEIFAVRDGHTLDSIDLQKLCYKPSSAAFSWNDQYLAIGTHQSVIFVFSVDCLANSPMTR